MRSFLNRLRAQERRVRRENPPTYDAPERTVANLADMSPEDLARYDAANDAARAEKLRRKPITVRRVVRVIVDAPEHEPGARAGPIVPRPSREKH